ncbi:glioma pathogenesis-related protein 1b isoform X1 [Clupea harengus]|uniref:Glioma pathogenesis-related protein 1b isoform X1 n=2 Tax=Clupea harengus TaxID=7950 RepID=A0A6P8ERT8_CLUHA|nr:glioma pathogenesis-related protein 1b isoform X1 [Clupea harengus]
MRSMAALCSAVLVCLSALLSVGSSGGLPDISDPQFIQSCVKLHNTHRSQAQPPARDMQYMTWDEALAKSAKSWAKKCQASHNPLLKQAGKLHPEFPRVGENIWVGLPVSSFSVENALRAWNDERQHYTLRTNTCNKTCGHYTQLLWAKSYKVGCAVLPCPRGITGFSDSPKAGIFVCNYGEGGNLAGAAPYTEGPSCAVCSKDHCESNLCRDPKRDAVKTHDWSLPVDSSSSALSIFQRTAATSQSQSLMVLFLVLVSVY